MKIFSGEDKMSKLIEHNYHLLPVLNRFDIKLGFRDKNIEDICSEKEIDMNFFLAIINTFNSENYFPEEELKTFSPLLIIDYLKKTHTYYLRYVLPKLENILQDLILNSPKENSELLMIESFYRKYKEELLIHIKDEEENVFPYVIDLIKEKKKRHKYSILSFEKEHSNVDNKINDLKNLIIKYIKPVYDLNVCNEFLITLMRFEKDLKDHARIEDKILIPRILDIEKTI